MFIKHCIIYFLVLLFVNLSICLHPGPVPNSARRTDLIESQSCEQTGWSCKDCSTLQSCGPDYIFKYEISCGDQFPDRPYCDPSIGRCVSDRHVCAEIKDPEFICPDVGIYPDLTDCQRYISCRAKGEVGLIYSCLFESVYNPIAKSCITNSYCYEPLVECNGEFKTMAYYLDPSLYIVCRGDQKPLIKDCGNRMLEYDPSLLACDFKCREEGRFAHPTNKTLFYICVYNNDEIVRMMGICREGTIYDEIYDTCVYNFNLDTTTELIEVTTELADDEIYETTTENVYETTALNTTNEEENSEATTLKTTTKKEDVTTIHYEDFETTPEDAIPSLTTGNTIEETTIKDIEAATTEEQIFETTTEIKDETTIHQDFDPSTEDAFPNVTTEDGQKISTEDPIEETSTLTTENIIIEETTTTSNDLETSIFTTDNIEGDLTTSNNPENITNSSEESYETTEKNDTHEDSDDTKETDTKEDIKEDESDSTEKNDTKEKQSHEADSEESLETTERINTHEESDDTEETDTKDETDTKEDESDSTEKNDTKEKQSHEDDDSNQSSKKSDEDKSKNDSEDKSNESKHKKRKCIGKICLPHWKISGFLKRDN